MQHDLFVALVLDTMREISARRARYFDEHALIVPDLDQLMRDCRAHAPMSLSEAEFRCALDTGLQFLIDQGLSISTSNTRPDSVTVVLALGMADAYAAAHAYVPLLPRATPVRTLKATLQERFALKKSSTGVNYFVGHGGSQTLLIVSSSGAPLEIWSELLDEKQIDRRLIVVESRCSTLLAGGMSRCVPLQTDVADIESVLQCEAVEHLDILAWCNGARVAIDLARLRPPSVRSLLLLAPTFHGCVAASEYPSPFEDSLTEIHDAVATDETMRAYLQPMLTRLGADTDLSALEGDPGRYAEAVLRLPPADLKDALLKPIATAESFMNYMTRMRLDEAWDIGSALRELQIPILLLTGSHDAAVNVSAAQQVLQQYGKDVTHVSVFGAGHHIARLQYGYLRLVLQQFLSGSGCLPTARLKVRRLAAAQ